MKLSFEVFFEDALRHFSKVDGKNCINEKHYNIALDLVG